MIKLYGNEIWNSNTPNQYKKVIIASESQFESITDALENAGLNYCGYMNNNKSYVAVGRATVSNLDKLNISYDSIVDSNNRKYVTNNIIGTAKYNDIGDKMYRKYNTDFAYKVAQRLTEQDIPFSGRIFGKNTTITVDNTYKDAINAIAHEIREQREFLYNDKAAEKNEPSATVQNSVTVSKEDNTENLFNALSVLHYKAPQLESLNSTVELLNNQPELIDLFSTMFENTSDFKPEQLNMLSMNFVKTYAGLSDSELILANVADFNEIKQSFINTNLADKLIENHGYSYAQSELIRDMVDMGIDYDTINLLDYTFSLTEMQTFIGAYSRSDYDSLINLVAKVKGVTRSEVEGMISDGTYTPALPDFNTLEKTLYFQESEVESITYMYYNPDAYSGGQFVITEVSYKQIAEAYKEYGDDYSHFFDFLDTTGEQRLIDVGSESFRTAVKKFYSGTEFAEGLNADIQHKLVELAVVPEIKLPEIRKIELIKVGDFYEVRGENAKTVADILDLVSTTRNINGSSVDTVGFPDFKLNDNTELLKTQGFTVNIKYEELAPFYEEHDELDDIDPAVIRQQLEDAGIVNGELVDEDKLNSDPFIQQVMAVAESDAGALNVSSEEIVNQFNLENEIVPINEPERTESVQKIIRPTITCDWSESPVFENGKTYSVSEFDKLMKNADDEWVEQRQLEIEEYGSENAVAEAYRNGELDNIHLGYEKTKFIINMPNGTKHTERQDIGDGIGGVIDFLEQYPQYSDVVKLLKDDIAFENRSNELLKPLLAFDEQVAIVNEFFDYEKAWHNVDDGISEIAEKYRNGDNIDVELAKHFINHYTNLNSAEITDDYEIQITSDGVSIQNSQFFQAYNWDTLGTHYFKYLYDTFNSIKEEQAAEYPEKESAAEEINNNTELHSVDELAMQLENDEKSTSEKSSVGKNNFMWATGGDTDEHAQTTSQPTLFDSIPVSDVSSDEITSHENYVLEDRESVTGAKTKFRNNITAIKILKQIEAENRTATPEEQKQLSLYSGWGGLANAFASDNDKWENEYSELKELLTADEYTAARSSVLDAFFTDSVIIDSIYNVVQNAGFKGGNILEPAMGIGNFFGRLPSDLRENSKLYGVEKDSLSGRIAKKLYPQADITIDGFENTRFNDNSFDVAIGNIPFGDFSVNDSKYNSEHLKIHDYFFLKSLDKVRDGGIVAFVTSKGTLDKKDSSFRKTLAERADLVGAVRLPNNAFKSAGTEVTADIIFLQKREKKSEIEPSWVHTGQLENGLTVNNYFVEHPEMILGEVVEGNKMFGRTDDTMCVPFNDGRTLSELLSSAVKNINFEYSASAEKLIPVSEHLTAEPLKLRLQSFYRRNGEIYFYGSDKSGKIVNVSADKALGKKLNHERINSFIDIRDTLRELLDVQQYDNKDSEIAQLQEKLNNCYDSFYSKYGLLHSSYNHSLLNSDGAYPLVASLEADFAKDNNLLVKKSDIFTERVNKPTATINHVDTAEEALAVCVAEKGVIDFEYMSQITDVPPEDLKIGLREKGEIFAVPSYTGDEDYEYQTASEYLSGDIYAKLDMAKAYASVNGIYESNVVALKEVLPTPLKAGDIDINLGATWIDKKYYEQFMYEIFETPQSLKSDYVSRFFKSDRIELDYSEYSGRWNITNKRADLSVTTVKTYGASGLSAYQIFESVLNLSEPKVYKDKVDEYGVVERDKNNKPVRVLDVEATQVVQQKANAIRREFKNWIFKDANRRRDIVDTYNRTFN